MEPIISPWLIYALPLVDTLICTLAVVAMLAITALVIIYTDYDFYDDRKSKTVKAIWAVLIISTLLAIFIPSKNTLIAMYIANQVTPDNLSNAQELITTIIKQAQ